MTKVDELELPHVDIFGLVHDDLRDPAALQDQLPGGEIFVKIQQHGR